MKRHKAIYHFFYIIFLQLTLIGCDRKSKSNENQIPNVSKLKKASVKKTEVASAPVAPPIKPFIPPKNIILYSLTSFQRDNKENKVFISLSEIYPLSESASDKAMPSLEGKTAKGIEYFVLEGKYKKRFFNKTKLAKTDSLFIYDYANYNLVTIPIKDLKVAAFLSPYFNSDLGPSNQTDYMIGFEIDDRYLKGFKDLHFQYTLPYIGKEDPFEKGKLKPIAWKKIGSNGFPKIKLKTEEVKRLQGTTLGDAHDYEIDSLHYFIQDHKGKEMNSARHLVVLNSKTKEVIFKEIYFEEDGIELAPLNNSKAAYNNVEQWSGSLFKAKPPVVFGFTWLSFGCPRISFLNQFEKDIYINCDNRH